MYLLACSTDSGDCALPLLSSASLLTMWYHIGNSPCLSTAQRFHPLMLDQLLLFCNSACDAPSLKNFLCVIDVFGRISNGPPSETTVKTVYIQQQINMKPWYPIILGNTLHMSSSQGMSAILEQLVWWKFFFLIFLSVAHGGRFYYLNRIHRLACKGNKELIN